MSKVVTATNQLEEQLREDGYKGTHRALRILKNLRSALETSGYSFEENGVTKRNAKKKAKR